MDFVKENMEKISSLLKEILDENFILIGLPKHMNLGDTLIWEAEMDIFRHINKMPKKMFFFHASTNGFGIGKEHTIVWNGGGFFGDVWGDITYIENVLKSFRDNKMIFMPNSVWFKDEANAKKMRNLFTTHRSQIHLMVRENQSLEVANKWFSDINNVKIYLEPDVVLSWDVNSYMERRGIKMEEGNGTLYIYRNDREKKDKYILAYDKKSDWPTMAKTPVYVNNGLSCGDWANSVKGKLIDEAINFIMPYKKVVSDRMHGAILAYLLGKDTVLLNNSYGKSKSLHDTWFSDDNKKFFMYGNENMYDSNEVTFIIPNRGGKNIEYVVNNYVETFKDYFDAIKFIVVTQVDQKNFKRGQLFNIGFKYADTKWIGLIDNDIFNMKKIDLIKEYDKHKTVLLMFDKIAQIHFDDKNNYVVDRTERVLAGFGAFNFMNRDDFVRANGFSNLCIGWGCEDNIFDIRVKMHRLTNTLCHITHPRRVNLNTEQLKFNQSIYDKYKNNQLDYKLDGLSQTTHTLLNKDTVGNVTYIYVNNIGVTDDFQYKDLYKKALSHEHDAEKPEAKPKEVKSESKPKAEDVIYSQMYNFDVDVNRHKIPRIKRRTIVRKRFR